MGETTRSAVFSGSSCDSRVRQQFFLPWRGVITPPITMVAIIIIEARDGDTVIAGAARRINGLRLSDCLF